MLVGESGGFADPVLAAGLTLTQSGAREAAYTILEFKRGEHDVAWLKENYEANQYKRVLQHIRFADFWYAANGQFTDLQDHCAEIAKQAGFRMSPQAAWQWLARGGFTNDSLGQAVIGIFETMIDVLNKHEAIDSIFDEIKVRAGVSLASEHASLGLHHALQALEVMINDGWVLAKTDKSKPRLQMETPDEGEFIHTHRDPK